ncbi:3-keto-5-aminohexanoate cleavage protein [Chloroflexota bacterium]
MDPLIISVATTGSWPTKKHTPYVPITPHEIADSAIESWREGAAIVHIHVRDENEAVSLNKGLLQETVELIRAAGCDIIINVSTAGGAGQVPEEDRLGAVDIKPEIASFDAGSMNMRDKVFVNSPAFLEKLARKMLDMGIKPEIECFDTAMITNTVRIAEQGLIKPPFWFQFVLGVVGGCSPTIKQMFHMVDLIPQGSLWSICAMGRYQLPLNTIAIASGGHARTGMEDNIYYAKDKLATSNAQLVARLVRIARECEREIASPNQARDILGIPRKLD